MRKIFTLLLALAASVGMSWAAKPTIQLYGNFLGEWADTEAFVAHETGPSSYHYADFSLLLEPGTYEFGVKVDGVLRANGSAYTRDTRSFVVSEGNTGYMTITTDVKGYYRFLWYYNANRLNADVYPNICGIYWKDVTDGQFEVTLGQESEVTIPKLWSTNSNFITNIANGVDQVRVVSTDEAVATIEYTLANDGLGTITFHGAGECDIYAVHDVTQLYAYDSCAFHLTVQPASTPEPETPEEVLLTTITVSNSEVNYTVADMVDIDQSAATLGENGWTSGTVVVSAKAGYTITKIEYLLSAGMFGVGGSDTEAPFEITIGSGKTLTKIEVYGYESGSSEPETTTYTLQLVADSEKGSVAVTNLLGSGIVDNGNGNYTVPENAEVTILATPLEGYEFTGWKVGNVSCDFLDCGNALNTNDNPYSFTMTADVAYLAEFAAVAPQPAGEEITPNVDPENPAVYYSTFYDSAKKYELPAGVEAYVADLSGANLLLTKIAEAGEVIPNDNAVILKSTVTPFTLTPSEADAVTFSATNDLQGSDTQIATPANCYVLAGTDGVVGFYHYTAANLNAHKAYVVYSGSNQAPRRMPFIFDQATGVENVQNSDIRSQKVVENGQLIIIRNGVRYNAAGQNVK